jgi:recombination protein RecT
MSVRNAVAERENPTAPTVTNRDVIRGLVERHKGAIGASLPSGMSAERFGRLLLTAANTNPDLFDCDPRSFLAAGVACAQLGLEPNDARGLAYLIPFKDKNRGKIVQVIIGYRGMMDLARRSGIVSSIHAFPVFEGDRFEYRLGLDPHLEHVPAEDGDEDPAKLTHVYAVAKVAGDPQFIVLTRKQVERRRQSSRGADSSYSPWKTHYVEMVLKSAIRALAKYLPQTVEMAQAMTNDGEALQLGDLGTVSAVMADPVDDEPPHHDAIEATMTDEDVAALAPEPISGR